MSIDVVRVSKDSKDLLLTLKRRTGIPTWNVLCRWALCASLAEESEPRETKHSSEGGLEIAWKTFAGEHDETYMALLRDRCRRRKGVVTDEELAETLRLHLHRGISYLAGDPHVRSVAGLLTLAVSRAGDGARAEG